MFARRKRKTILGCKASSGATSHKIVSRKIYSAINFVMSISHQAYK